MVKSQILLNIVGENMLNELTEPAGLNWESVIHRGARTKDGESLGYIAANDKECIYVLSSRFSEYRIPKSRMITFDGSVVRLDLEFREVNRYKIGRL